ncbi:MAG: D-glycerate dehydrogenase [Parvularculaceae bacterium]|nr:D-glycerate dehydrogenase [Parvularculaceae bacterium]
MAKPVLATPRILPAAMAAMLRATYEVREPSAPDDATPQGFARLADGAAAIFVTAFDDVDAAFVEALPRSVRFIASIGVGVDHIDLGAARARGLVVSNTPDVTTPCLADATMGLIIAALRRFREGLDVARTGEGRGMLTPESWGVRVSGKTLGVVGMGNVGRAVARRARAFDMAVLYATPRPSAEIDRAFDARAVSLDVLLAESDVVSLHCPLKDETHHLIDGAAIDKMKFGATLVNIARGPLVDEAALVAALASGRLFAAGLDVYETEPGPIREALRSSPNVFCLPHVASATRESRAAMAMRTLANIDAFFATGAPLDRVA